MDELFITLSIDPPSQMRSLKERIDSADGRVLELDEFEVAEVILEEYENDR